jgi:hypothetical protein
VTTRNGQRQERRQVPGASANYTLMVGGLVQCRRCACLVLDTKPSRDQHDNHHAALRTMYERIGARP